MSRTKPGKTRVAATAPRVALSGGKAREGTSGDITMLAVQSFQGPLPPPADAERYEELHPGTFERLLKQFELEAEHRRKIERQESDAAIWHGRWSLIVGSSVLVGSLATGGYLLYLGRAGVGLAALLVPLGLGLVGRT